MATLSPFNGERVCRRPVRYERLKFSCLIRCIVIKRLSCLIAQLLLYQFKRFECQLKDILTNLMKLTITHFRRQCRILRSFKLRQRGRGQKTALVTSAGGIIYIKNLSPIYI